MFGQVFEIVNTRVLISSWHSCKEIIVGEIVRWRGSSGPSQAMCISAQLLCDDGLQWIAPQRRGVRRVVTFGWCQWVSVWSSAPQRFWKAESLCYKYADYFWFPFANWRRTSSWSEISYSSPLWGLALFFLCFLEVVTGSPGWGTCFLWFLFFVEVVTRGSGSGDGDRLRFFLFFLLGGVACVMKSSASSSSLSTCTTFLLFFATESPFSGRLFFLLGGCIQVSKVIS